MALHQQPPPPPPPSSSRRLGNVSLSYFSGITEPLAKVLNSKGLSTTIQARGSLRESLVKPKDKLRKEQQVGVVYHIPCAGANSTPCTGTYVGETERTASARFNEHTSTSTNAQGKYKSAMLQHARKFCHHFQNEDITILASNQDWVRRRIREAIYIKGLSPLINIDPGRHAMSSHFDSIIKNNMKAPPAPTPHNPELEPLINIAPRRQGRPPSQSQQRTQPSQLQSQSETAPIVRRSQRIANTQRTL